MKDINMILKSKQSAVIRIIILYPTYVDSISAAIMSVNWSLWEDIAPISYFLCQILTFRILLVLYA